MSLLFRHLASLLFVTLVLASNGIGTVTYAQTVVIKKQVARGIDLIQEITPASDPGGPLLVTILIVNPRERGVKIEATLAGEGVWDSDVTQGRGTVSDMVSRRRAVAGINAGFFPFAGNPIGLHIQNGEIVTEPTDNRSCFGITERGEPFFGSFTYDATVSVEMDGVVAARLPINGLNRPLNPKAENDLVLYTPTFWNKTLPGPKGTVQAATLDMKLPLRANEDMDATVRGAFEVSPVGISAVVRDGSPAVGKAVLMGKGASATWLRQNAAAIGAKLKIRVGIAQLEQTKRRGDLPAFREMIAGGPRLVTDGKVTIPLKEESMSESFSTTKHPRTAIGQTRDGKLLFVTVDGRQAGLSRGISLDDLAKLFLRLGTRDAVNMDGGGSSACVVRNGIVNAPSDGKERPVANMFLLYGDDLRGDTTLPPSRGGVTAVFENLQPTPNDAPPTVTLAVNETFRFTLSDNVRKKMFDRASYSATGIVGVVTQDGTFRALRAGVGAIHVTFGGSKQVFTVPVRVTPAVAAP